MKLETKLIFISFSKYATDGINYHVFPNEECMRQSLDKDPEFTFLCEIVVPGVSKADVAAMATGKFDQEIADHCVAIEALTAKKQQFLA